MEHSRCVKLGEFIPTLIVLLFGNLAVVPQLAAVLAELKKNEGGEISGDLLDTIRLITKTLDGIKGGESE